MKAPVKVVHVIGSLDRGVVETSALMQCRLIPPEQVRQMFVALGAHEGMLAPDFRAAGAEVHRCPLNPKWTFPLRLWRLLYRLHPNVVESHVSLTSGLVLAVASAAGVPKRIARLRTEGDGCRDTALRRLQRKVLRELLCNSATSVLGVTRAALDFADPSPGDFRYQVMPDQVDVDRFASARLTVRDRCGGPVLTHVGRAAPEKNRGFLLSVHAEARRLRPDVRLVVAGPGGIDDLEAVAPRVTADRGVCLVGPTDQVEEVFASSDVLLLPSRREEPPTVVLEALAAGVPVLASDLPGLRELAEQVRGLQLLPLQAGAAAWANSALTLASTPESERDRISEGIRRSPFALAPDGQWWKAVWTARR